MLTYHLVPSGDVDLILLPGLLPEPDDGEEDPLDDLSSQSDTLLDDAASVDTLISSGLHRPHPRDLAVRFRVFSYRLRTSSPVFRALLEQHVGRPGAVDAWGGTTRIPLRGAEDPAALALVLRVLHEDSPREDDRFPTVERFAGGVDLAGLAQVAAVVERYRLHAAVEHCLAGWVDRLWARADRRSPREAAAWAWIAWVFELTDHFAAATGDLARAGRRSLAGDGEPEYPLPRDVLETIDRARTDALTELYALFVAQLHPLVEIGAGRLGAGARPPSSPWPADAVSVQEACKIGWFLLQGSRLKFWPRHEPDFRGTSYADVAEAIRTMGDPLSLSRISPVESAGLADLLACKTQLVALLECLDGRKWDLAIDDFKTTR